MSETINQPTDDNTDADSAAIWAEVTGIEKSEDADQDEESSTDDTDDTDEEGTGEEGASETADDDDAPSEADDALSQLKDTVDKLKEKMEDKKDDKKDEAPPPKDAFVDPYDRLDAKSKELLQKFEEDYPEVKDAFQLSMGMAFERLIHHQSKEQATLVNQINKVLAPLLEMQNEYKSEREERRTRTEIPEYDKVTEWIGKQPKVVQKAYTEAMKAGGDDRKEVIQLFRKASENQTDKQKEQSLRAMTPVRSRRAPEPEAKSTAEEGMSTNELWNRITKVKPKH